MTKNHSFRPSPLTPHLSRDFDDVLMRVDVLGAIARRASALRTVTKTHLRVAQVRHAADGAGVAGRVGQAGSLRVLCHPPPPRSQPQPNVAPEKQQEIAHRGQHQQRRHRVADENQVQVAEPLQQRQPLHLYRQHEEQQELEIGK